MKSLLYSIFCIALVVSFWSCKEEVKDISEQNTTPPGIVTDVRVENLPGAARIAYRLPMDQDLLYVKAVYTLSSGRKMEVKSSYYNNFLIVEGFADEADYTIDLFAVNRSEVNSQPVQVTIRPKENPIWDAFRSLEVIPAFGGIRITGENEKQKDITIMVMVDSLGEWVPSVDNIYTATKQINRTIRGLDTVAQTFAITVRDKYMNFTDTMITTLKPLYETALSKSRYAPLVLPGDAQQEYTSTGLNKMWDGDNFHWPNISLTKPGITTSQWVTFDTGALSKMSRIVIWDYPEYTNSGRMYFFGGNLRQFEIWGSTNPPSDGSWNNWHLLGTYVSVKPSGLPAGQQTDEDYQLANSGLSYDFDIAVPKVRYLRIKSNRNWQGSTFMSIAELQVYGDPR
ncbi:DUF5000 domain-containing lipoprotein [Sphingobacterium psychroaquaticum]|uniref:Uncharacterized protein n=1 Tax=Sphingobacterium psychroaquaticum TaxID=561061 RepID=A0A1X7I4M5_9SPHI|nr:DUF5000 domain-containing lipoprotein [Sphingobacterium psychroaquaticum]QBQ41940.1 DUF4959 domain-containing protein [Sphingobacterium psychroaquaticum]SMG09154.1 protein of unknown function [Sphingobacterium psychroaquaticum]